jgi:hypothetical protein
VIVGFVIADEVEVTAGAKVFNRYLAPPANNQQIISAQDRYIPNPITDLYVGAIWTINDASFLE